MADFNLNEKASILVIFKRQLRRILNLLSAYAIDWSAAISRGFWACVAKKLERIITFNIMISLLLSLEILYIFYLVVFYRDNAYLPAPFVVDKQDTFMDFFNVFYWVDNLDRYTSWRSVYPPLNFVFIKLLQIFLSSPMPFEVGKHARLVSFSTFLPVLAIYILAPAYVVMTPLWRSFSVWQRGSMGLCILLSPVFLFTLERGNLVVFLLILTATSLAYTGPRRTLSIALMINVKPYCVLLILVFLSRKRLPELVQILAMSGFIFLTSGLIIDPNFLDVIFNIINFGQSDDVLSIKEILALPSSASALSFILRLCISGTNALQQSSDGFDIVYMMITIGNLVIVGSTLLIIAARSSLVSEEQGIVAILVAISNLGVSVGGYSMLVYPAMIPVLLPLFRGKLFAIAIFLIMVPWDIIVLIQEHVGTQLVYLSGRSVDVIWQLGVGAIVRPLINLIFLLGLIYRLFLKPRIITTEVQRIGQRV